MPPGRLSSILGGIVVWLGRLALAVSTVAAVGAGAEVVYFSLAGRPVVALVCGYLMLVGLCSGALLLLPVSPVVAEEPGEEHDQGEADGEFDEFVVEGVRREWDGHARITSDQPWCNDPGSPAIYRV